MKIERLHVGWISSSAAIWRQGDDPERTIRFPIPAYLIETDSERILLDTGLSPAAVAAGAERHYGSRAGLFTLEQEESIADQVDLSTLTRVVLTHLHFDHAGGLHLLPPGVPIVVQRGEWQAGHDTAAVARNFFFPRDYTLDERRLVLVDGDHDLLGDGSVELLLTPGHTPGHQSVRVGGRLLLGVDVAHFAATLDDLRFPVFADDFAAQTRSAERLRALRDTGVDVVPGHDPEILEPGPLEL
ncbi:MAG TPA: N-acyl homoserine lactonase family protein [Solirubrobacteraceae bacterium]|nr:N-acyl homoserine lactonase family protein [Solirubrobacteraceae bacterium]